MILFENNKNHCNSQLVFWNFGYTLFFFVIMRTFLISAHVEVHTYFDFNSRELELWSIERLKSTRHVTEHDTLKSTNYNSSGIATCPCDEGFS